ncbi:class I SAM-dependent methyltransferase [Chloroflexus sp.]|uniref:class I SAM-dependent methyltransferase n=1 Tax=Chloroflexus sp. TaxID=1904827 RepID=UPI002ACE1EB6|nr:class I SAM-dependent methyltransferase [Chloroflexus sp.]
MIYHDYAPIYHAAGQAAFGTALAQIILAQLPAPPQRVLDLACGTGAAALVLAAAGATVVGVDGSPAMLAIARAQARQRGLVIEWIEADIRALPDDARLPPASFDLCTCLFDSLNHLTDDDDLVKVCRAVGRLLRPGGQFIFDLNTLAGFRTWYEYDQVLFDGPDLLVVNRLHFDHEQQRAYGRFVWFQRRGERWWRSEETHCERPWHDDEIAAALASGGLRLAARLTSAWTPAADDASRVVYVAERQRDN